MVVAVELLEQVHLVAEKVTVEKTAEKAVAEKLMAGEKVAAEKTAEKVIAEEVAAGVEETDELMVAWILVFWFWASFWVVSWRFDSSWIVLWLVGLQWILRSLRHLDIQMFSWQFQVLVQHLECL